MNKGENGRILFGHFTKPFQCLLFWLESTIAGRHTKYTTGDAMPVCSGPLYRVCVLGLFQCQILQASSTPEKTQ